MADLSALSNEELLALSQQPQVRPVSQMTDDELLALAGQRQPAAPEQRERGMLFPISYGPQGDVKFPDWGAGITGAIGRAATAPGDVYTGQLDPASPEGMARATEMAAVFGPAGAASRVKGSMFAPKGAYKTVTPQAPTAAELGAAKAADYKKAADLGVEYKGTAIKEFADNLQTELNKEHFYETLAPEVHALIKEMQSPPRGSTVTMQSLEAFRRRLGTLAGSPDATKASAATQALRAVDDFYQTANPASAVAGTAATKGALTVPGKPAADATAREAIDALQEARANAAALFRSERATGLETTVARRAAAANSGRNLDNTIRQRLTSLVESAKGSRGLSKEEIAAIDDIIFGRKTKNALRFAGNFLGGGGGLGSLIASSIGAAGGAVLGGPGGAALGMMIPTAAGGIAKSAANRMSANELKALDEMMRARSPLGRKTMTPYQVYAPRVAPGIAGRAAASQMALPAAQELSAREKMARLIGRPPGPGGYY